MCFNIVTDHFGEQVIQIQGQNSEEVELEQRAEDLIIDNQNEEECQNVDATAEIAVSESNYESPEVVGYILEDNEETDASEMMHLRLQIVKKLRI